MFCNFGRPEPAMVIKFETKADVPEIAAAVKDDLPVTALAAADDGVAVGALGEVVNGNAFEIISVYVAPQDRRKGAAFGS